MIFLTGSSGFIGTNFANFYIKNNIKFIGLDKKKNSYINFNSFKKIDLLNKLMLDKLFKKHKPKLVLHLAANPGLNFCHTNRLKAFKNNIETTFNLLELCKKHKCKKILISSSMAAENYNKFPSFYGFSKLTCENLFKTYKNNFGLEAVILRFSNVFGPFSSHKNSAIHKMIKCALKKNSIFEIHGSGKQKRDFIYSEDLIKQTIKIYKKEKNELIYNINTKKNYSVNQIFSLIQKISNKTIASKKISPPKGYDVSFNLLKTNKLDQNLKKNLNNTIDWYRNNL